MKHPKYARTALLLAAALTAAACSESSPTETTQPTPQPWNVQFMIGNSSFNTGDVTTNEDGVSADIVSDYVMQSALPNTALEVFITHIYIPTSSVHQTRISNINISVGYMSGARTGNILSDAEFVQQSTIAGQRYDVFRLEGFFNGTPAIFPSNFANVVFTFRVEYLDGGAVVATSNKMAEIYKR